MDKFFKLVIVFLFISTVLVSFSMLNRETPGAMELTYSDFVRKSDNNEIGSIKIEGNKIYGITKQGTSFSSTIPNDQFFANNLIKKGVAVTVAQEKSNSLFWTIFISWFPMLLFIGIWIFFMKKSSGGGGGGGLFSVGKHKASVIEPNTNKTKFSDVAGCEEAKEEVKELVDFLKEPHKFENLGGKTPKGILLVGPPGTGKTLLARAIAGEANVPFFSATGSDFVEMFVGVGAARVRDLFDQAKKSAPCIIFIDEIDTIGGKRGSGFTGASEERDGTLNQLLTGMDGFETNTGVVLIGATNRPESLDAALVRPGRLDRQVVVPLPDVKGRECILQTHSKEVPIDNKVDLKILARGTPGFSGADLANLVNEAAIMAAKENVQLISMKHMEKAKDKIMMGTERKSMQMPEQERINTAYHEAGHAIIALMLEGTDPLYKVSIIPRNMALGVTMQLPEEDKYTYTKAYMMNTLAVLFGGRCAEEIFMKNPTTGASNDFQRATNMARQIVCSYGMSDLGVMVFAQQRGSQYLGGDGFDSPVSEETKREIDNEIRKILNQQYQLATKIINDNFDKTKLLAEKLLEVETLDIAEIKVLLNLNTEQTKAETPVINIPASENKGVDMSETKQPTNN